MAQKKLGGSSKNGRDSNSKKLGFKKMFKCFVKPGDIIIKQKGNKFLSGINTIQGKDKSISSLIYGYVNLRFFKKKKHIYVL